MLNFVTIDIESIEARNEKLVSLFSLVANEVEYVEGFRIQDTSPQSNHPRWARQPSRVPDTEAEYPLEKDEKLIAVVQKTRISDRETAHWYKHLDLGRADSTIFSNQKWVREIALNSQGLTAQNSILLLASAGLELMLPSISVDPRAMEELGTAKALLVEERQEYINAVTNLANESLERLTSGVYVDTIDWARSEALFNIGPAARRLESSMALLDKGLLKRLKFSFIKDGIPAIGKAFGEQGLYNGVAVAASEVLKILSESLAVNIEKRNVPEANYGIMLANKL